MKGQFASRTAIADTSRRTEDASRWAAYRLTSLVGEASSPREDADGDGDRSAVREAGLVGDGGRPPRSERANFPGDETLSGGDKATLALAVAAAVAAAVVAVVVVVVVVEEEVALVNEANFLLLFNSPPCPALPGLMLVLSLDVSSELSPPPGALCKTRVCGGYAIIMSACSTASEGVRRRYPLGSK
jgi:hypothetical protein